MTDIVLWSIVALTGTGQIIGLAGPSAQNPPKAPGWITTSRTLIGLALICLWGVAALLTGYWQLLAMPVVTILVSASGVLAKASES